MCFIHYRQINFFHFFPAQCVLGHYNSMVYKKWVPSPCIFLFTYKSTHLIFMCFITSTGYAQTSGDVWLAHNASKTCMTVSYY